MVYKYDILIINRSIQFYNDYLRCVTYSNQVCTKGEGACCDEI